MTTLQAKATRDQCAAIRKDAWEKYELMEHCLDEREWEGAADLLDRANRLMALAARLEERQAKYSQSTVTADVAGTAGSMSFDAFADMTERERLNRAAGLS